MKPDTEAQEASFRRGYVHGYHNALDDLLECARKANQPIPDKIVQILNHHADNLQNWRTDRKTLTPPPNFGEKTTS